MCSEGGAVQSGHFYRLTPLSHRKQENETALLQSKWKDKHFKMFICLGFFCGFFFVFFLDALLF